MNETEAVKPPSVMSVGLKYGLISAGIGILIFVIRTLVTTNPFENSWVNNVVSLVVTVTMIVLAQREFKTNGDGYMSYGQGFGIGMVLCIVSIVASGLFTMFYGAVIDTDMMDNMLQATREQMEANNTPDAQIDTAIEWTKKLFWPMFFIGGIFFSTVIVLLTTIFTQRKNETGTAMDRM